MIGRSGERVRDLGGLAARLGLQVLGALPVAPAARVSGRDLDGFVRALDRVRASIVPERSRPGLCVLVTSSSRIEGRTLLASQLAGRCSAAGMLALLVDADLENPTLGRMFERPEDRGLVDVLAGEASAEEAIRPVPEAGFHFLPAGSPGSIAGGPFASLMARARASFDVVIVDGPPAMDSVNGAALGRSVDGVVLVVRADRAAQSAIERAVSGLTGAGSTILGVVGNGVDAGSTFGRAGGDHSQWPRSVDAAASR